MTRRLSLAPALASMAFLLFAAPTALAKEPPRGGYLNEKGVITPTAAQSPPAAIVGPPGSNSVYVTQPTDDGTALARVDTDDNGSIESRTIAPIVGPGFTIPTVAIDKSTSGLSADGRTLVLAQPLTGLREGVSRFEILDARSLRMKGVILLHGSYSFDAISPDGRLVYLIEYTNPADPSRYLVRAYNVAAGHLVQAPVIDPSEAGEPMTGKPVTRTMSPDGRWAYTLYQGSDEGPFVHALDTSGRQAKCIDLVGLNLPENLKGTRLGVSSTGDELSLIRNDRTLGTIDTHTWAVSPPPTPTDGHGFPWVLIAILALVAAAGAGIASRVVRRRRRLASG
jgi:hypothetical protein